MSKLVIWLLSPLGAFFCLAGLALLLAWRRRLRGKSVACHPGRDPGSMDCGSESAMTAPEAQRQHLEVRTALGVPVALGSLALIWLWAWSMPVTSLWLRGTIEDQFPQRPIAAMPQAQALVVLGGGVAPPSGKSANINLQSAADRVWYAARLFHAGKAPLLILSGGSDPERDAYSEARAMAYFLRDLGVPPEAMVLEETSRNTRENAALSATLLKARGIHHILLVTSALHMPRSLALFSAQGLQAVPAPTDFEAHLAPPGLLAWLPDALALDGSGRAMKELVGKWVGW